MKIGLGLYRKLLTAGNFRFARQLGAGHIVAHLVDYDSKYPSDMHSRGKCDRVGWPLDRKAAWAEEGLRDLKAAVNAEGLKLVAIENIEPADWCDILLDGPRKAQQLEAIKQLVRRLGKVGIPVLGYNFSIAGVWGHVIGPYARGGARSIGFLGSNGPTETPIPAGHVWNIDVGEKASPTPVGQVSEEELWQRLRDFLEAIIPVAEESGVRLAAHPDDPPMPTLRGTPRLVYGADRFQRLLDLVPSPANALDFCMGTVQEMKDGCIYEALDKHSRQNDIAYIHFRNVRGKVPEYHEVFVDEGDIDMVRALRILIENDFAGILIPDHAPELESAGSWHAGMAYTIGYMRAAIEAIEGEDG